MLVGYLHRHPRLEFHDEAVLEYDDLCDQPPDERFVEFSDCGRLSFDEGLKAFDPILSLIPDRAI